MKNLFRSAPTAFILLLNFLLKSFHVFLMVLLAIVFFGKKGAAQTAISSINTTYNTATTGTTYSTTGAVGSPLSGNTYTYNFGTLSGSTSNSRQLNNFISGGSNFAFVTLPGQFVKIRRVNNAVVTGTRSLRYSEGAITGSVVNVVNEYNDDMEVFFNGNTNFNSGSDNLFANQGDGNGNNNNIERLDVIFPSGVSATDNTKFGFSVFERGDVNVHDPIRVAVVLSIDVSGNPTSYSGIVSLASASYGTTNPLAAINYVISRRETATETNLKASTTVSQGVGGVFVKISDFGIANNTTIYGYSIIPNDFTGATSADIIAYTNATLYPTNTSSATGTGGIDLVSATGIFQSGSVINRTISGNVYNDVNGLTNSLVDGTGTNAGGLNAILVNNTTGNVVASIAVAADGTYSFGSIANGTYTMRISNNAGTVGAAPPAVVLPTGWALTGEGTTAAGDGTVNGITNTFVFSGGILTNVNFGIEELSAPSTISATSQVNPGGATAVTVAAATFGAADPSSGTINSIRISSFPTNTTTITINGTSYTSGTFPGGGVSVPTNTTGQPTQTITLDPIDGAVTAVITYYATDNAGKESSTTGTASMPFTTVTVNGNVFNDVNGLSNSLVDGTGTNAGGVNAILVDNNTGNVAATIAVAAGGTYTFPSVNGGTYTVRLSTTAGTVGAAPPAVSLPAGWVTTGEGTTAASDGTVNGITNTFTVTTANITAVNFGIEQPPTPSTISATSQVNPGGATAVTVAATTFGATDPSSGTIGSIRISSFPTNTTTITINGTSYTSGTFPGGGVSVPTNTTGQPTQTITLDPINGAVTAVITYYATDNAGRESSTTGTASMPFTTVTVSGNVFNDVNGLSNSLVDGTGTNAGGVNAILVDNSTGNVAATIAVAAGGTYTFPSVNGGTYTVRLSTTAGTVGAAPPAVSLPVGWVTTGEGTTAASDGTVNGITNTFTVTTANITAVNFGIEQPPTPSTISATSQVNPGGATAVTVAATTFGATDPSSGTIGSIRISSFPTNTTTITINGTSYTSGTFPGGGVSVPTNTTGQPTQTITLDPINGAVTAVITYYATDNAGRESSTTGTASIPFTTVTVSGNVFNDVNGLSNSLVDGTGTNAGGVNAILVDNNTGNVAATIAVAAGGTYTFPSVNGGTYTVRLSTTAGTVGAAPPAVSLPAGWVTTGEGTTAAGDGTVNGITNTFTVTIANITAVNFGIEQPPTPSTISATSQVNPGGATAVTVAAATFGAADPSSGTIGSIRISSFPTNTTTITINGTSYTSGTFPGGGVSVPTNITGQPTQTITLDPIDGAVTAVITYFATDNAGKESSTTGTATIPFSIISMTGTVFNDLNRNIVTIGTPEGGEPVINGTNSGGGVALGAILFMNLIDAGNIVIATTSLQNDGTYTFGAVPPNTTGITLQLTTNQGTIGAQKPRTNIPAGWLFSGENKNGQAGTADGAPNGEITITTTTINIAAQNFGVELRDSDRDGVPDNNDIDDDNDGLPDILENGGFDPLADTDGDGTSNYLDATPGAGQPAFGDANGDGVNDFYDADKDGLINEMDLDTDNDGIADIVEAGGIDTNGDGIIDNYSDTDGDGLINTYDATNGGVNIANLDTDGDGVPNYKDLDSDNDGIPDVVEAYGTDANNDGLLDNYTDTDNDGLNDTADGDVGNDGTTENTAAALIITSTAGTTAGRPDRYIRANSEGTGMANPYDLDSDGDGITDATESGITAIGFVQGMVSGCVLVNGWCSTIDGLPGLNIANSDGIGNPDVYDIDSDNDGITDNIEAQSTGSYMVPADADTDGDGIANVYDVYNGMGGNGLTPYDLDGDSVPDYLDTDTDNDGSPDRNEADKNNANLLQATIDTDADTDGDGLMDMFDTYNISAEISDYYRNVSNSNFGPLGNYDGPMPDGSNVSLIKSVVTAPDRDWRNVSLLAIYMTNFEGNVISNSAMLNWTVVNVQQILNYVVERSFDMRRFDSVTMVYSFHNSYQHYESQDVNIFRDHSVVYYRIKQMDIRGKYNYSKVIELNKRLKEAQAITIYPNPVKNILTIQLQKIEERLAIVITDFTGKVVIKKEMVSQSPQNVFNLTDVSALTPGMYVIKISSANGSYTQMMLKQ